MAAFTQLTNKAAIKTTVFVDGNHAFLNAYECVSTISKFELNKFPKTYADAIRPDNISLVAWIAAKWARNFLHHDRRETANKTLREDAVTLALRAAQGKTIDYATEVFEHETILHMFDAEYTSKVITKLISDIERDQNVTYIDNDLAQLKRNFIPVKGNGKGTFWYDANARNDFSLAFANHFSSDNNMLHLGMRRAFFRSIGTTEKQTDVNIAIQGMKCLRGEAQDSFILFSNDTDFDPLLREWANLTPQTSICSLNWTARP